MDVPAGALLKGQPIEVFPPASVEPGLVVWVPVWHQHGTCGPILTKRQVFVLKLRKLYPGH